MKTGAWLLLAANSVCGAQVEVYRWTDEAGVLHFGDRPAAESAELVEIPPANGADPFVSPERPPGSRETTRSRPLSRQDEDTAALTAQRRLEACLEARSELRAVRERRRGGYGLAEASVLERTERDARAARRAFCD